MNAGAKERFASWLERFPFLHAFILRYDGEAPRGRRYINRINGHVLVKEQDA